MDNVKIGKIIHDLRTQNYMTQENLGEKLGVSHKSISKWECGNSLPALDDLCNLSKIFNVSLDQLLGLEKIKQKKEIDYNKIINIVFLGLGLASGICLLVTSFFESLSLNSGFLLTGIGLSTISMYLLRKAN